MAVLAAALAAAVAVAALQTVRLADRDDRIEELARLDATRRDVALGASRFAAALLSYDHGDLERTRSEVLDLATDGFAATYDSAFARGLEPLITELEATAEAEVREVYVAEVTADRARAIVVADSSVRSSNQLRRLIGAYLEMDLVRVDGRWLVDAVTPLTARDESILPLPDG